MIELPLEGGPPVFGGAAPTTDAYPTSGGVFTVSGVENPYPCPCDMVSIASTKTDMPKMSRQWDSGVENLKDDNLNQPY